MKKTKLIMSLITCCFALSVLAYGVYAMIVDIHFSLSGNIQFEVNNIAQVNSLKVIVKNKDGTLFNEYDEKTINKKGSEMNNGNAETQSIGDVDAYINQTVEIHLKVQSLSERYVKISLTHNSIANNTDYTKNGIKVRTNSVILAPQSEDGNVKEFIIYVQYLDLDSSTKTMQEFSLDNNFVIHFEESSDILKEQLPEGDQEGYWYVEMGTIPTATGSEYIRWRYFTSYIDPETDGNVNSNAKYSYEQGVRPTLNSNTGCFILETDVTQVKRGDSNKGEFGNLSLNYCNYCNDYIEDPEYYGTEAKCHKQDDLNNVQANDYATSTIRDYINGRKVYKVCDTVDGGSYENTVTKPNLDMDNSDMLADFCIDTNDLIYNKIISRDIDELYSNNKITINGSSSDIKNYKFVEQDLPTKTDGTKAYAYDSDEFWLLSYWEAYYILGTQVTNPSTADDKRAWSNSSYYLRSIYNSEGYEFDNVYMVTKTGNISLDNINNNTVSARPAFKMTFN